MAESRFAGPVLTYIVLSLLMAALYAVGAYVTERFGGTIVPADACRFRSRLLGEEVDHAVRRRDHATRSKLDERA